MRLRNSPKQRHVYFFFPLRGDDGMRGIIDFEVDWPFPPFASIRLDNDVLANRYFL